MKRFALLIVLTALSVGTLAADDTPSTLLDRNDQTFTLRAGLPTAIGMESYYARDNKGLSLPSGTTPLFPTAPWLPFSWASTSGGP